MQVAIETLFIHFMREDYSSQEAAAEGEEEEEESDSRDDSESFESCSVDEDENEFFPIVQKLSIDMDYLDWNLWGKKALKLVAMAAQQFVEDAFRQIGAKDIRPGMLREQASKMINWEPNFLRQEESKLVT
jgi:hypothetical protein